MATEFRIGFPHKASQVRPFGSLGSSMTSQQAPSPQKTKRAAASVSHWCSYWRDFGVENQPHERCFVPGDGQLCVDQHWSDYAEGLAPNATILDLGCGAGILGKTLLKRRPDLQIVGIDFANVPSLTVKNLTVHPWVSMEALPFDDRSFDAAVSLFGIEYGDISRTAGELNRVLKPGSTFSFLVHHHNSEIAREGRARLAGLKDVLDGKLKAAFLNGKPDVFHLHQQRMLREFGDLPSVITFVNYFGRHIARTRSDRQAIWQKLYDDLQNEIKLTAEMARCAKDATQLCAWLAHLMTGLRRVEVSTLNRKSGDPIAWHVAGRR